MQWQQRQGQFWDTFKPLEKNGLDLRHTLLIDDSPSKSWPGEDKNMIVVPTFQGEWLGETLHSRQV